MASSGQSSLRADAGEAEPTPEGGAAAGLLLALLGMNGVHAVARREVAVGADGRHRGRGLFGAALDLAEGALELLLEGALAGAGDAVDGLLADAGVLGVLIGDVAGAGGNDGRRRGDGDLWSGAGLGRDGLGDGRVIEHEQSLEHRSVVLLGGRLGAQALVHALLKGDIVTGFEVNNLLVVGARADGPLLAAQEEETQPAAGEVAEATARPEAQAEVAIVGHVEAVVVFAG